MLYKYLPPERIDVLKNLKIRFSPLGSLNDPFEALPLVDLSEEKQKIHDRMEKDLKEYWDNLEEKEKTDEEKKEIEKARNKIKKLSNKILHPQNLGKGVLSNLADNFGVLSLSRSKDNLLMWSHYTEEGKGYVLSFNKKHDFFNQKDQLGNYTNPTPVAYTSVRSTIKPDQDDFYQKMFCEKPIEWHYEEEERVFRIFPSLENSVGKDKYNNNIILTDIPKDCITGIYIGYQASRKTKSTIFEAIKKNSITCPVYHSEISKKEYRILFKKVKNT